jgi:hypothetical protein
MALVSSGAISLGDVRTELGLSGTISLNDPAVRALLGRSSGVISLSDAYGKSAMPTLATPSITATGQSANLHFVITNNAATAVTVQYSFDYGATWTSGSASAYGTLVVDKTVGMGVSASMIARVSASGYLTSGNSSVASATEYTAIPSLSISSITSTGWTVNSTSSSGYYKLEVAMLWNTTDVYPYGLFYNGASQFTNWYENTGYSVKTAACDSSGNLLSAWSQPSTFNTLEFDVSWYGWQASVGVNYTIAIGSAVDIDSVWFYATSTTHTITFDAIYTPTMSSTFDAYLELYNGSQVMIFHDDDSGGNRNSKIVATGLTVGNFYVIRCKTFNQGSFGNGNLLIV